MPFKRFSKLIVDSTWNFMEIECQKSIKKLFKISVIAEAAPSEPFFMPVITVIPDNLFHAAAETDIALPVITIRQRIGYINR